MTLWRPPLHTAAAGAIVSAAKRTPGAKGLSKRRPASYLSAMASTRETTLAPTRITCAGDEDGGGITPPGDDATTGIATKTRTRTKKPSLYKVLMLNDDYTPMEFVVMVLQRFFRMDIEQATRVMLHVHQRGVGVCGIYSLEVAETKVNQVLDCARANQHPLQCTLEKA